MTFGIRGLDTDRGSEIDSLSSATIMRSGINDRKCHHSVVFKEVREREGPTDLNETFKLNGETSFSLFAVAVHHASFVLAASLS